MREWGGLTPAEPMIPLTEVVDLITTLDRFWPFIELLKRIEDKLQVENPDFKQRRSDLERAREVVKVKIEEWR